MSDEEPEKLSETEKDSVEALITFCDMFLRGFEFTNLPWEYGDFNDTPMRNLMTFAWLNLVTTMFLITDGDDRNVPKLKGACSKVLEPLKLAALLEPIEEVLDEPLGGGLSFGNYVQYQRNKMCVHGGLSYRSFLEKTKGFEVDKEQESLDRYYELLQELGNQTVLLKRNLKDLQVKSGNKTWPTLPHEPKQGTP